MLEYSYVLCKVISWSLEASHICARAYHWLIALPWLLFGSSSPLSTSTFFQAIIKSRMSSNDPSRGGNTPNWSSSLLRLPPAIRRQIYLEALKSLTVHLNGAPCCLYGCCGRYTDVYGISCSDRGHKESLANSVPRDQAVLEESRRTANYITAHAKLFNLELYLIADVHDHKTALQVVDPILNFARLRRCVIRPRSRSGSNS